MASREGSNAGSMSPARERRLSRPRGVSGSVLATGRDAAGAVRGADCLRETCGLPLAGLRVLGGCFDKCL
jgi:hypothetical protein